MYALKNKFNSNYYFAGFDGNLPTACMLDEGGIICFATKEMAELFLEWNKKKLNLPCLDVCQTEEEIEDWFSLKGNTEWEIEKLT